MLKINDEGIHKGKHYFVTDIVDHAAVVKYDDGNYGTIRNPRKRKDRAGAVLEATKRRIVKGVLDGTITFYMASRRLHTTIPETQAIIDEYSKDVQ